MPWHKNGTKHIFKSLFYNDFYIFIEAMHLIDKHNREPTALPQRNLSLLYRLTNVLDAAQHGADGDELGVKRAGHQPRNRGFSGARWPPQNATVRLAGLEGKAQGHALAQQVLLANDFSQRLGSQALGQGLVV